ncbi:ParA family protein [Pseudomonas sp.]|uniref:ParA family protein n=1 Tax=Pseudomonas sp. TaxID=306 RepID=UPI0029148B19|nr:ParA family protein [Pseudomonas sp.]MDU4254533.1 ParA family protein [Pseudomonas sp.]
MTRRLPVVVSTNYKGGVGKTTTSRVLSQAMAAEDSFNKGKPVLVIDLDPQGNTSRRWQLMQTLTDGSRIPKAHPALADEKVNYSSVCDLWLELLGEGPSLAPVPYVTSNPMIHVVPPHEFLMGEAMHIEKASRPKLGMIMRNWLRDVGAAEGERLADRYCCAIIDTQPSKTTLIDAALMAATHCYIPFIPEPQSVDGVYSIISYIHSLSAQRGKDVPLEMLGLLPNMVQNTRLHNMHLKELRSHATFGRYVMPVKMNRRIAYSETDDWRNLPESVTELDGTQIEWEARKWCRHIMQAVQADVMEKANA